MARQLLFVVDGFRVPSPGQQLLDRFLLGYPAERGLHVPRDVAVGVFAPEGAGAADLARRQSELGLVWHRDLAVAAAAADAAVVAWGEPAAPARPELLTLVLERLPRGAVCFVAGVLALDVAAARAAARLAASRRIVLLAGTPAAVTWRLPQLRLARGARVEESLMVTQGRSWQAELEALDGLLAFVDDRRGGGRGVRAVRSAHGDSVWAEGDRGAWSWELLASALSRSDTPQGTSVTDGRTQDLVGLGEVQRLARQPRAWMIEHEDGLRSTILVVDGVVADLNVAVRLRGGEIVATQLYRPPAPGDHQYSRLAEVIEQFVATRNAPWRVERCLLTVDLLAEFARLTSR